MAERIWTLCRGKEPFAVKYVASYEHDVEKRVPDASKVWSLGWRPKVGLNEGLEIMVNWVRSNLERQDVPIESNTPQQFEKEF